MGQALHASLALGERNAGMSTYWYFKPIHRLATVATTCEDMRALSGTGTASYASIARGVGCRAWDRHCALRLRWAITTQGLGVVGTSGRSTVWRRWLQRGTGTARNACIARIMRIGQALRAMLALRAKWLVANGTGNARFACAGRTQCWDEHLLALQADPPSGDGGYNVRGQALRAMLALSRIMLDGTGSARFACAGERNAGTSSCWHFMPNHRLATVATSCGDRHCAQCLRADPPSGDGGYFASGRRWRACRIGSCLAPSPCWAAMQCSWAEHSCYRKIDH